jgi:hypothetical protein
MPRQSIEPPVLKYLQGLEDKSNVAVEQLVTATGLQVEQVRSVMYRLVQSGKMDVSVVTRGHLWRLNSKAPRPSAPIQAPANEVFKFVGRMKDGTMLVHDTQGTLYELKEV